MSPSESVAEAPRGSTTGKSPLDPKEGGLTLREQSRRQRFTRVLEAAEELFRTKGYKDVTTKEVARQAGVGEATLFRYVTNKEELLLLVMGEKVEQLLNGVEARDNERDRTATAAEKCNGAWYIERILAIYQARVDFYVQDPENVASYLICGLQTDRTIGRRSMGHGDRVIFRACRILRAAQDAGVIRADVDASLVAVNCHGLWIHEILRLPARAFDVEGTWERLRARLLAQLAPLLVEPARGRED